MELSKENLSGEKQKALERSREKQKNIKIRKDICSNQNTTLVIYRPFTTCVNTFSRNKQIPYSSITD